MIKYGKTALHVASLEGYVDIAKVLIQNGADVNAIHRYGSSPLCRAVENYHIRCALHLLCSGAKIGEHDLDLDNTGHLGPINDRLKITSSG